MVRGQCVMLNMQSAAEAMTSVNRTWQMFERMLQHAVTLCDRPPGLAI